MMRAAILLLVPLLLLVAPAVAQTDDRLVVPGVRIGQWTLAMTIDDLAKIAGSTTKVGPNRPQSDLHQFRDHTEFSWSVGFVLTAFVLGSTSIRDFRHTADLLTASGGTGLERKSFRSDRGIGFPDYTHPPPSTYADVYKAYGAPTREIKRRYQWRAGSGGVVNAVMMVYDPIGVYFDVLNDKVSTIGIFRAGSATSIFRF